VWRNAAIPVSARSCRPTAPRHAAHPGQRATLFQRLDARFTDLASCVEAVRVDLARLSDTAKRTLPAKENLFSCVEIDQATWERVQHGVDRWGRRAGR